MSRALEVEDRVGSGVPLVVELGGLLMGDRWSGAGVFVGGLVTKHCKRIIVFANFDKHTRLEVGWPFFSCRSYDLLVFSFTVLTIAFFSLLSTYVWLWYQMWPLLWTVIWIATFVVYLAMVLRSSRDLCQWALAIFI